MSRRKKPNHMYGEEGNTDKLSKKRIKELEESIVRIGGKKFSPPSSVVDDSVALCKWKEIMYLYANSSVEILTSADIGLLERYCLTYMEYLELLNVKKEINHLAASPLMALQMSNDIKLDTRIDAKNKMLLKMDGELFLTPVSKSRAIPRKKKTTRGQNELNKKGFDNL